MYTIRGELDEAYVQKLTQYVDEKMRAITPATATVDTQKVKILGPLLAIADELHGIQKYQGDREDLMREAAELAALDTRQAHPETNRLKVAPSAFGNLIDQHTNCKSRFLAMLGMTI